LARYLLRLRVNRLLCVACKESFFLDRQFLPISGNYYLVNRQYFPLAQFLLRINSSKALEKIGRKLGTPFAK